MKPVEARPAMHVLASIVMGPSTPVLDCEDKARALNRNPEVLSADSRAARHHHRRWTADHKIDRRPAHSGDRVHVFQHLSQARPAGQTLDSERSDDHDEPLI